MASIDINKYKSKNSVSKTWNQRLTEILSTDIQLGGTAIKNKHKEHIYGELYTLLSSGIDIKTALELISFQQDNKQVKKALEYILGQVIAGATLAEAFRTNGLFSPYEYYSIQIGEESGTLTKILNQLNQFYANKIEQNRKILSALSYPAIVTLTAFFAIFFMLRFLVPMFDNVYKRFGGDLPWVTKKLLDISNLLVKNNALILLVFISLIVLFLYARKTSLYKKWSGIILLKIPGLGNWIKKIYITQFCSSMSMMLGSKVSLTKSLELVNKQIEFYPLNIALELIYKDIFYGESLHKAMSKTKFFTLKMETLVKVGEEVNQLDKMFEKLNAQYQAEMESQSKIINTILEPLIILVLGAMVGFILVALYLPLFNLSGSFGL